MSGTNALVRTIQVKVKPGAKVSYLEEADSTKISLSAASQKQA